MYPSCEALLGSITARSITRLMLIAIFAMPTFAETTPLDDTAWRLVGFQSMSDKIGTLKPSGPLAVQLRFQSDGQAAMKLDCNRGRSSWSATPSADPTNGRIEFGPVASTRALCPGDCLGEKFASDAPMLRGYMIRDGRLALSLMADAGIYIFNPIPPKASVEDGGPRVWTVTDAPSGLNLRSGPGTDASIVSHFRNGDSLDNLGCETADDRLWCYAKHSAADPSATLPLTILLPHSRPMEQCRPGWTILPCARESVILMQPAR